MPAFSVWRGSRVIGSNLRKEGGSILRNRAAEERQKRGSILHSLRDGSRVALIFAMSGSRRVAAFFVIGLQKREA